MKSLTFFSIFTFSTIIFLGTIVFADEGQKTEEPNYLAKMANFEKLTLSQDDQFIDFLDKQKPKGKFQYIKDVVVQSKVSFLASTQKLKFLYQKQFITKSITPEEKAEIVSLESRISIATHRHLVILRGLVSRIRGFQVGVHLKVKKLVAQLVEINAALLSGSNVRVTIGMGLQQLLQAGRKVFSTACNMIMGMCMKKSLSDMMDGLEAQSFLRSDKIQFRGLEEAEHILSESNHSVFILIGNHDQPLFDIALARQVSLKLGSQHHMTMTRKSVYPVPPPETAGDVIYVIDGDKNSNPVKESVDALVKYSQSSERVSLAVYPEGMLPYTGGQMPMITKEGAFVIARKVAPLLAEQGIDTYLVEMNTNIIEHLTSKKIIDPTVDVVKVEKVPTSSMIKGQPDPWIESRRLEAENNFNLHRGNTQIDIFDTEGVKGSLIPAALPKVKNEEAKVPQNYCPNVI